MRLKQAIYESARAPLVRSPFLDGEGKEEAASPQKGSQPRLAALGSPFPWKGLAWILPPSYGRRCPEGAEVGWGKRYEKERGRSSQAGDLDERGSVSSRRYTAAPYPPLARSPFPDGEGKEEAAPPQKGSQPRLAALGSPFQGKGLAWSLPPSSGRRCPEGAEVGWG